MSFTNQESADDAKMAKRLHERMMVAESIGVAHIHQHAMQLANKSMTNIQVCLFSSYSLE